MCPMIPDFIVPDKNGVSGFRMSRKAALVGLIIVSIYLLLLSIIIFLRQ